MNIALTRPQSLQELYKTYFSFANRFQFTSLLRNYIQNEEWKDRSQEPVWDVLSKISDDIGAVLTDDIVNYTRNVVDVNTCKVPELIEHAQMLSYKLDHLKNSYEFFPKRIQCLVDIFSVNPEYLLGNHQNHILSDTVIKEILIYIRENVKDRKPFINDDAIDKLLDDPHSLTDHNTYYNFIQNLFYVSLVEALSAPYSSEDAQPIAFNLLFKERHNQQNVLSRIEEYKSWIDRYIWNEIEYPLNDSGLANTIYDNVESIKNQKQISVKFNPFKIADHVYFNGLNPNNGLSDAELDLVEMVLDYHAKTKYDYEAEQFVDDISTQYAYYKELEFCEYVKLVMFIMNNINQFHLSGLTYDISSNKFMSESRDDANCMRVVNIFNEDGNIVEYHGGRVALNHEILLKVAKFLCDYVFHIQGIRENMKTIAHKHAMRGSAALLVHIVNDYLVKELPFVRDMMYQGKDDRPMKFLWETDSQFRNYGNVKVLEYEDDNEYFNIDPEKDVLFTERTNERYWEQLENMGYDDTLGVLTKGQIKDFYRNILGMGRLQPSKSMHYDDVADFLVDLFKIGANPIEWKQDDDEYYNPIDDIENKSEEDYGYTKEERLEVQRNTQLRKNQERQFKEYSGNDDLIGDSIYDLFNSKLFYWKNTDYSSHVLHPFMYNLKLWNKLNNIIINGYRDYIDNDLIDYLSSKTKFDEIFGEFGQGRKFWKYNIVDFSGYTTRYEAAVKDERLEDDKNTISELTGYDGLFYPTAAKAFLDLYNAPNQDFTLTNEFFKEKGSEFYKGKDEFIAAIYSIYWQDETTELKQKDVETRIVTSTREDSFYTRWYSHLNYTRSEYQKIALQLWYWRDRICELISIEYPMTRYCLDVQGNSLILVSTFKDGDDEENPYLVDLAIAQEDVEQNRNKNRNASVSFCDNKLKRPSELWIRWKSNPIALPAFDTFYDHNTGDYWFDFYHRTDGNTEMGQLTHTNSNCNDNFKVVLLKWRERYEKTIRWKDSDGNILSGNRLPVFFDMEQSANVLAIASWYMIPYIDTDGIVHVDSNGEQLNVVCCSKNPMHIISLERTSMNPSEYCLAEYSNETSLNNTDVYLNWLFDSYQYCQANGALMVPLYSFDCVDEDGSDFHQYANLRVFLVPAQELKGDTHVVNDRLVQLKDMCVDLNQQVDFNDTDKKYRFDYPIKVCRNTRMVFSAYDRNGLNRMKCAFLGVFDPNAHYVRNNYGNSNCKISSCMAKTRYEYDSQSTVDLGLTKGRYFKPCVDADGELILDENGKALSPGNNQERDYIDGYVAKDCFNSYDSNDKYVFVLDFDPSIDHKSMFDISWKTGFSTYTYNILGDAGYIPHFAYQSLIRYEAGDRDGGTAYTWKNSYTETKDHMQFELLGLDDKALPLTYEAINKLVVDDLTDDCSTLLCPAKFMDDIYRIWCETRDVKTRLYFPQYGEYQNHFHNEFVDYPNPQVNFAFDLDTEQEENGVKRKFLGGGITVMQVTNTLDKDYQYGDKGWGKYTKVIDWDVSETVGLRDDDGNPVLQKDTRGEPLLFNKSTGMIIHKCPDSNKYEDDFGNVIEGSEVDNNYETRPVDIGLFELDLPQSEQGIDEDESLTEEQKKQKKLDAFKKLLDDYYVYVVRTEKGNILNEKRYILPPTKISEFVLGMGNNDGFMKCSLSPYQTPAIQDEHFVNTQVVFAGTPNPFSYDLNGNRIYSKPEELQYGNSLAGVDSIELKIDIVGFVDAETLKYDESGNPVMTTDRGPYEQDWPVYMKSTRKFLKPTLRFVKNMPSGNALLDKVKWNANLIPDGEVTIMFSHKNLDNLAKYHIMNRQSNLYFDGSLPKNPDHKNQFKFSDFKYSESVMVYRDKDNKWKSFETDSENNPILEFDIGDVGSEGGTSVENLPPYYVEVEKDTGVEKWYIEQDRLVPSKLKKSFVKDAKHKIESICDPDLKSNDVICHVGRIGNNMIYDIPKPGDISTTHPGEEKFWKGGFRWAHKVKSEPEKYLDYFYIANGGLAFKVSEESYSFAEAMSRIPPFYIDFVTRNKLQDLNNIQVLKEYSTFIHQSENPDKVKECGNFNPLIVDAILRYGVEQKELYTGYASDGKTILPEILDDLRPPRRPVVICTEKYKGNWEQYAPTPKQYTGFSTPDNRMVASSVKQKLIELNNTSGTSTLLLQLDDGEIDDYLKIYTNYVRVDDGYGDFHYDLYFNIQNLFNSPFEYISTVTGQPNVLILKDSYLYLTGDKYKKVYDQDTETQYNEIDENKVSAIKEGGELTIYGQVKTYSGEKLSDVKTIKMFTYKIHNISDDKPKFLIEKTYDITKSTLQGNVTKNINIEFSDVLWTLDEVDFDTDKEDKKFKELKHDVTVVQPVKIRYNWDADDDFRIKSISFDLVNDVIDFNQVPVLCEYWIQDRTLRDKTSSGKNYPYYDHWSDRYMKLENNEVNNIPRLTLTYDELNGHNFETIYLRWKLPAGCRIMDTIDRLGGYVFSSTAANVMADCNSSRTTPRFNVTLGHVVVRVHEPNEDMKPGKMYLGLEHSSTKRLNGYVLKGLADSIKDAFNLNPNTYGKAANPTFEDASGTYQDENNRTHNVSTTHIAIPEIEIQDAVLNIQDNPSPKQHSITLNANGGTVNNKTRHVLTFTHGTKFGNVVPDTWGKNEFIGWFNAKGVQFTSQTLINSSDTLYARWKMAECIVTFKMNVTGDITDIGYVNGDKVKVIQTFNPTTGEMKKKYPYGVTLGELPTFSASGDWSACTPQGWWTEDIDGDQVGENTNIDEDITLYAHLLGKTTIKRMNTSTSGREDVKIERDNREHLIASGFAPNVYLMSTDKLDFSQNFDLVMCGVTGQNITNNQEIFGMTDGSAHGGVPPYTHSELELGAYQGKAMFEFTPGNVDTYDLIKAKTLYYYKVSKRGDTLYGYLSEDGVTWKYQRDGKPKTVKAWFVLGSDYDVTSENEASEYWRGTIDLTESYVNINGCKYEFILNILMIFNANTGSFEDGTEVRRVEKDIGDVFKLPKAFKTGYELNGWYSSADSSGTKIGIPDGQYVPDKSRTVFAHWDPIRYYVNYNGNGNTFGTMSKSEHFYDKALNLTDNGFARTYTVTFNANGGYCTVSEVVATRPFKEWRTKADGTGTKLNNKHSGIVNLTEVKNSTVEIYAQWGNATITLPSASKANHNFVGWYDASTGGTKIGDGGASYTYAPTQNSTLYAHWDIFKYDITLDANEGKINGKNSDVVKYDHGSVFGTPTPIRDGYVFDGWYSEATGGTRIEPTTKITESGTYYAHWQEQIVVTFDKNCPYNVYTVKGDGSVGAYYFADGIVPKLDDWNGVTKVIMLDGITEVGSGAFDSWRNYPTQPKPNLQEVVFPSTLKTIRENAFKECENLTNVTIPDGVTSIGHYAFNGCKKLTNLVIPDSVTNMGEGAFNLCSGIESITIGNGIKELSDHVFHSCGMLTGTLIIPDGVTTIGSAALAGLGVSRITFGSDLTTIKDSAFDYCSNCKIFDFRKVKAVPSYLNESCLFYRIPDDKKIIVPDELYDSWRNTEPWNATTDYWDGKIHNHQQCIVKASESSLGSL